MNDIQMTWQRLDDLSARTLHEIIALREAVFVVEQACAYQETDAEDLTAWHLTLYVAGRLAGYLRLIETTEPAIGRVLIAPAFRGRGLARRLMREGLDQARRQHGPVAVHISAQAHLRGFYESLGFIAISEIYLEDGIPHQAMVFESAG
ncbi:GNAT family N-acetyltransferase [Salinisphaera sp. SPP-AMP-43]|uniref:GNAT family N-acetyltransferase n=1 Tax=Salinisphaera sp. SPP-AMP-43 TaxID=3121288 RepID=UPI003C6DE383